jgi:hypothetical protein
LCLPGSEANGDFAFVALHQNTSTLSYEKPLKGVPARQDSSITSFKWWPAGNEAARVLQAHQTQLLLAVGNPETEAAATTTSAGVTAYTNPLLGGLTSARDPKIMQVA